MGLRYRKSINFGSGFRVNISKSGIGYSFGTKGFRHTKTADGKVRNTYSIPGTGLSYVQQTKTKQKERNDSYPIPEDISKINTEVVDVNDYNTADYKDFIDKTKKAIKVDKIGTILLWLFIFFPFTTIAGVILKIISRKKMIVPIEYNVDQQTLTAYNKVYEAIMNLNSNEKFRQVISHQSLKERNNGGASTGFESIPVKIINTLPYFIKSNILISGLQLRKQQVFFLPDKILFIDKKNIGAIDYKDINLDVGLITYLEEDNVPKDTIILGNTWKKVNNDGTPDKRFKNNHQVYECQYGKIILRYKDTLYIELILSNPETLITLGESLSYFK